VAAPGQARCGGGTPRATAVYNPGMGWKLLGGLVVLVAFVGGSARSPGSPAPVAFAASSSPVSPPLGISGQQLGRVDSETLSLLPGARIDAGSGGCASRAGGEACWSTPPWSFSPGSSRLALARNTEFGFRSLRLVDVRRLSVLADLRFSGGPVGDLAWLGAGRLLAVQEICCSGRQRLLSIDVAGSRVTARRLLWGTVLRVDSTPKELVLLLAPARGVGAAKLAVADPLGEVRLVGLTRVAAGVAHEVDARSPTASPGLAVDPAGRRAYVVTPTLVAAVDLRTLAVSYHALGTRASLLGRVFAWLEPAAQAKEGVGRTRYASWLGGGLVAVAGSDFDRTVTRAAGLSLVDTRSWKARTIDREADGYVVAPGLVLATGPTTGLTAYGLDGRRRFRLFGGQRASVLSVYAGRAYVDILRSVGRPEQVRIVDLSSGRDLGTRAEAVPTLLIAAMSGWWGP